MNITEQDKQFMREAIRLASESVMRGGGPFGAVIVKDGEIIAGNSNSVTIDNDPTAHAEVNTIRKACKKLGTFDLSGCTIYTSCEPCPMCLGAIYWAKISRRRKTRRNTKPILSVVWYSRVLRRWRCSTGSTWGYGSGCCRVSPGQGTPPYTAAAAIGCR